MTAVEVSVIVPAYNCERFLEEAVVSILEQQHPSLEIVVIDDGSTDATPAVADRLADRIRYIRQSNAGPSAARNRGLRVARGEVIAFLDGDDLWTPGSLARLLGELDAAPDASAVMGQTEVFVTDAESPGAGPPVFGAFLSATLFRRGVVDEIGGFDENLRVSEDYDWIARLRERGLKIVLVDAVTHRYRRHDQNLTIGIDFRTSNIAEVLKRSLDRRRALASRAEPLADLTLQLDEGEFEEQLRQRRDAWEESR